MSMSSAGPSNGTFSGTDTPLELKTVFEDPAGLRIARFIVNEYLKADAQRATGREPTSFLQNTFSSVSPTPSFDSSPEFRRMLEERLVFRATGPAERQHARRGNSTQRGGEGYGMARERETRSEYTAGRGYGIRVASTDMTSSAPLTQSSRPERNHQQANLFAQPSAQSGSQTSYLQSPSYSSFFGTSQSQASAASRPQFRPTKSQNEREIDALFEDSDSHTRGTESPYRVESPSGLAPGRSPSQNSPQRRSDNFAARPPSVEDDPFQLSSDSLPLKHAPQPLAPRHSYLSDSGYFSQTQLPPASFRQSAQHRTHTANTALPQRRTSPTIKSFLPVNKTPAQGVSRPGSSLHRGEQAHIVKYSDFYSQSHDRAKKPSASSRESGLAQAGPNDNSSRHNPSHHNIIPSSSQANRLPSNPASRTSSHIQPSTHQPKQHTFDLNQQPQLSTHQVDMAPSAAASKKRKSDTSDLNNMNDAPQAKRSKAEEPNTHGPHPSSPTMNGPPALQYSSQARGNAPKTSLTPRPNFPSLAPAAQLTSDLSIFQPSSNKIVANFAKPKAPSKKRKMSTDSGTDSGQPSKMIKAGSKEKPKRIPKAKVDKPEPAKCRLGQDIWMRILEFTPPQFLKKARLINHDFNNWIQTFTSVYVNLRIENFGTDMPGPILNLTHRQYNCLLGGKGCLEKDCKDSSASRTHWSWAKRWCWGCWKKKIEREDRVIKMNQAPYGQTRLKEILECIAVGMHDSFLKPHDLIENLSTRPIGAPRLYRYFLKTDVQEILAEYDALTPPPYKENPEHTPEEKTAAQAAWQAEMDGVAEKQTKFLEERQNIMRAHMEKVVKIEACLKRRRIEQAKPYNAFRKARRELFTRRARQDLPHIPIDFVQDTAAYKAATRIFRDGGTERGWLTLKPKIEMEYQESLPGNNQGIIAPAAPAVPVAPAAPVAPNTTTTNTTIDLTADDNDESEQVTASSRRRPANSNPQPISALTMQDLAQQQQQHQQRQHVFDRMAAAARSPGFMPSMADPTFSSMASMTSMTPSPFAMGYSTMGQIYQNHQGFGASQGRSGLSYGNLDATLFPRQQQSQMNASGLTANMQPMSNWSYNLHRPFVHNNTHQTQQQHQQSSAQGPSRIPVGSLLNAPSSNMNRSFPPWSGGPN